MSTKQFIKNYMAKVERDKDKSKITLGYLLKELRPISTLSERIKIDLKIKELKKLSKLQKVAKKEELK